MTDIIERMLTFHLNCDSPKQLNEILDDAVFEIEKMRTALMFYADKDAYEETEVMEDCLCCMYYTEPKITDDKGKIARTALGNWIQ